MTNEKIEELKIDEGIWIIFILLSLLNIYGDECEKDYYTYNDFKKDQTAKKIFTFTVFISLIIYIYFAYRNYQTVENLRNQNKDYSLHKIRLIGSIFVVTGVFLLLYFQIGNSSANNPSTI